jgi:hypothetical protein
MSQTIVVRAKSTLRKNRVMRFKDIDDVKWGANGLSLYRHDRVVAYFVPGQWLSWHEK